jgi:hypothetical protein
MLVASLIAFLLVLVTGVTPLYVLNSSTLCLLNNHGIIQSSKSTSAMLTVSTTVSPNPHLGYHVANMVVHAPVGQLPRSSNVADFYGSAPMANEEQGPYITTSLSNLATATGSDRATVVAPTNALAELTVFTQSQSAELRCLAGTDTLAGIAPPTHVLQGTATVVRGNGLAHTFERQEYKTKNNTIAVGHMGTRGRPHNFNMHQEKGRS